MKSNFFNADERSRKIPASKARYQFKSRRRLKRDDYRLGCAKLISYFKIPYLRFSLNPFSIAFLILVIFSSDVWPHTKSSWCVSGSPVHVRHRNHRMVTTGDTFSNNNNNNSNTTSKSEPYLKSVKLSNFVNMSSSSSPNTSIVNYFDTLRNINDRPYTKYDDVESGAMFLKPPQFLKRFGRSSKPDRISASRDADRSRDSSLSKSRISSSLPPCSHVGDATNDISARAYLADTIFVGQVRSLSTVKDAIGKYGATFVVKHVLKDASSIPVSFKSMTQVRLFFVEKSPASNTTKPAAHCVQRYSYSKAREGDQIKANVKQGRRYIVFVNRIGVHNYTIVGEPVPQSRKNARAVKEVLCSNCVKQIAVYGLKNETVNVDGELRLVCRIRGTPLPALQWFKDGAPIIVTSRLRIQYKKRRSLLLISKVRSSDSGQYECRGLGVQSVTPVSSASTVKVITKFDNITALWPLEGKACPTNFLYCLNGGTCTYYETIGELTCQCADGYNGGRCENKDVVNSNSTYEPITCFDGVTPSYPCVTVHKP